MKGYLLQKKVLDPGQKVFLDSYSPENSYGVAFEDDGESGYFYALEKTAQSNQPRILDALHIFESAERMDDNKPVELMIVWTTDWLKCALILDGSCHALFDFENQGGYNINEFPPPNSFWTKHNRKLTTEIIQSIF